MPEVKIHDTHFEIRIAGISSIVETAETDFKELIRFLGSIGFYVGRDYVGRDKDFEKRKEFHPFHGSEHYKVGGFGDLRFQAYLAYADVFGITLGIGFFYSEFYSNLLRHPYSGKEYADYIEPYRYRNMYESMPYLVQKRYDWTKNKLLKFFEERGYIVLSKEVPKGEAYIVRNYIESLYHPQKQWFSLREELDGQVIEYVDCYGKWANELDRDGKIIRNGDIKYLRDENGYLAKGRVYYDRFGGFYILLPDGQVKDVYCTSLFDPKETDFRGRRKKKKSWKSIEEYKIMQKYASHSSCSKKKQEKELRRRRNKK